MAKKPLKVIAGAPDKPLVIGDIEIPCYVLEDEARVLSQRGLQTGLGMSLGGGRERGARRIGDLLTYIGNKGLNTNGLMARASSPIEFHLHTGGRTALAYPAPLLVDLCALVLEARDEEILHARQMHIAQRADILMRGLAITGIIGLVDEATGYQEIRSRKALATILENFIADEVQPWKKTFPYEFYKQIFKLKGWPGPDGVKRPGVIGHYTNDIVYKRVAPGVFDELKKLNPSLPGGGRKWRNHQWFKPEPGYIKLNQHIAAVIALMKASANWDKFQSNLKRAFPKLRDQLDFDS